MSNTKARIIRDYLSEDEPFGPIDAREISDPDACELLFERHNKIQRSLHKRPSIILGRKGSGKTSYLNTVYFYRKYTYVIELNASEALSSVIESISSISSGVIFAESVKEVWRIVILIGFFCEVRGKLSSRSRAKVLINNYFAKIGLRDKGTLEDTLWKITEIISRFTKGKTYGIIPELLKLFDNVTFVSVLTALENEFEKEESRAVILLDSLDDFQLKGTSKIRCLRWESLNTKSRTRAALHEFSSESFDQIVKIIMGFPLGIMQPPSAWPYAEDTEEN